MNTLYEYEPFQWMAVSKNGEKLYEINEDNSRNSIKEDITISDMEQFGIYGEGQYLNFNLDTGIFDILNNKMELLFEDNESNIIKFSNNENMNYRDVIIYRTVEEIPGSYRMITSYNFGFKSKFDEDCFIKCIFTLSNSGKMNILYKITFNEKKTGNLKFFINDKQVGVFQVDDAQNNTLTINLGGDN